MHAHVYAFTHTKINLYFFKQLWRQFYTSLIINTSWCFHSQYAYWPNIFPNILFHYYSSKKYCFLKILSIDTTISLSKKHPFEVFF